MLKLACNAGHLGPLVDRCSCCACEVVLPALSKLSDLVIDATWAALSVGAASRGHERSAFQARLAHVSRLASGAVQILELCRGL